MEQEVEGAALRSELALGNKHGRLCDLRGVNLRSFTVKQRIVKLTVDRGKIGDWYFVIRDIAATAQDSGYWIEYDDFIAKSAQVA